MGKKRKKQGADFSPEAKGAARHSEACEGDLLIGEKEMVIGKSPDTEDYLPEGLGIPRNPKLPSSAGEDFFSVHKKGKPRSEILIDGLPKLDDPLRIDEKNFYYRGFLNGMNVPD